MFDINETAVLGATIFAMILGAIWYSQAVFGKAWMKAAGLTGEGNPKGMWKYLLGQFVSYFVLFYVLAHFLFLAQNFDAANALAAACWIAVLVGANNLMPVIWERKSLVYYAITMGYSAVSIIGGAFIMLNWPW